MVFTPSYKEGVAAHLSGEPQSNNPYPSQAGKGLDRTRWFNGWYDSWRIGKWGRNDPTDLKEEEDADEIEAVQIIEEQKRAISKQKA